MILQLCGLSGAGKSTLATLVKTRLTNLGIPTEIIDGDEYRAMLCKDLGFSKADRCENIRRLGFVASKLSEHGVVVIIAAINPYEEIRNELTAAYPDVFTVFIDCTLGALIKRDTKGLYHRALLPDGHPDKLTNLTGVNDPFDIPVKPDLHIRTGLKKKETCAEEMMRFIMDHISAKTKSIYLTHKQAV